MTNCPSCRAAVSLGALKCPGCGLSFDETSGATAFLPQQGNGDSPSVHSTESADGARFPTGTILAERYRIVSLLGRGGMGEVYKAEDLKLKQIVALKFLPEAVAMDGASLARFQNEVRITRQISHPNVCRVYDIGETNGLHFLSMEFIDGEDLSLLLRRIGRLPGDKANEIARQICAGLAAAHDNGVLHRDLKPANIMIDGRGKARVTDFGVAVVAKELLGPEALSGTPAYMAPEQLKGQEVTQKSDIYSLGLVLYELFTGKKVYDSNNIAELMSLHETSAPSSPSSHIEHMDPLVERVIMRCLERQPGKRPASAIQVATALPGGDPLAAALAAGETPSPEMVAASGENTGFRPVIAVALLAATILALGVTVFMGLKANWRAAVLWDNSPEALAHRAQVVIHTLGYTDRAVGQAYGLEANSWYTQYASQPESGVKTWNDFVESRPGPVEFWYRQSPRYLEPINPYSFGWITEFDPAHTNVSGMVLIEMDATGRMVNFIAVPPQLDPGEANQPPLDWAPAFAAAGIDRSMLTETASTLTPIVNSDTRMAWTGVFADQPALPVTIEAAAYRGKLVLFMVRMPWDRPAMMQAFEQRTADKIGLGIVLTVFIGVIVGAALLARKNLRQGRGDRRGAARLSFFVLGLTILSWLVGADHTPTFDEIFGFFVSGLSVALVMASFVWLLYIALEPYVRRRWPEMMVSWSRVLAGQWRDSLVARDVLIGVLAGVLDSIGLSLEDFVRFLLGNIPLPNQQMDAWLGTRRFVASAFLTGAYTSILFALVIFFLIFLFRVITRRRWAAVLLFTLILTAPNLLSGNALIVLATLLLGVVAARFGLLSLVVLLIVSNLLQVVSNFSPWFLTHATVGYVFIIALAAWAFQKSLAGQKLFSGNLLEGDA